MQFPLAPLPSNVGALKKLDDVLAFLAEMTRSLGFDYFAYGRRPALPFYNPQSVIISNYPNAWQRRYSAAQYIRSDPTIAASRRSMRPLVWSDEVFTRAKPLWNEARDAGLRVGCAQFITDGQGNRGLLTLARTHEALTELELQAKVEQIHWLSVLIHEHFPRVCANQPRMLEIPSLTEREIEILRWSADGKTVAEIALILPISANTVNFHLKNAMQKLTATNKATAILRAVMYGLLE